VSEVIFICVANSGRSVMAERIFNRAAAGRHHATSAGSEPGTVVHPAVIDALREIGLDATEHTPTKLRLDALGHVDAVVSTCGEEACPVTPPRVRRITWNLPDPKNRPLEEVREIRDEIGRHVEALIDELDARAPDR
jgi:protein-tyrosine-phosphatase